MRRLALLLLLTPLTAGAATPVTTAPLSQLLVQAEHSAPGIVVTHNSPALSAEISARIDQIPVRVGDRVNAGDTLVRLDCRSYRSQLAASRARLQQLHAELRFAGEQLKRANDLKRKKSISEELVEQRQSELDSLSAQEKAQQEQVEQANIQVEHCTINAPVNGVVTERLASVGGLASPGTTLLRVVQLDQLEVSAQLREEEASELAQATRFWFDYQGKRSPVRLRQLLPVVDSRTRSREVRLVIDNDKVPAGAAGRLVWQAKQHRIPADYLVRRGEQLGVFHLNGDQAHFHPLPEALEGQPATIDLKPDTRIILEGRYGLQDGDPVSGQQTE